MGAATLGLELAVAVLWPAPRQAEFDPSGTYGEGDGPPLRVAALGDSTLTAPGVAGVSDIWVTEVWTDEAAHRASLQVPEVKEAIRRGLPLIATFSDTQVTTPVGGVGLGAA